MTETGINMNVLVSGGAGCVGSVTSAWRWHEAHPDGYGDR